MTFGGVAMTRHPAFVLGRFLDAECRGRDLDCPAIKVNPWFLLLPPEY